MSRCSPVDPAVNGNLHGTLMLVINASPPALTAENLLMGYGYYVMSCSYMYGNVVVLFCVDSQEYI